MGRFIPVLVVLGAMLWSCSCDDAAGCQVDMDCPGTQMCVAGECVYRTCVNLDCDDSEPCTVDSCEADKCVNTPVEDGTDCGETCDGLAWVSRTCQAGVCTRGALVEDCDDGSDCTVDSCHAESGCDHQAVAAGTSCGTCAVCDQAGACVEDLTLDSDCPVCQQCATGGSCSNQPAGFDVKDECPDGQFCNGQESCDGNGACQAGPDPCPGLECNDDQDECYGCQDDAECPVCQVCSDAICVNQPEGSDQKDECQPGECATGDCNGSGACGGLAAGTACEDQTPDDCANAQCDGAGHCDQLFGLAQAGLLCRASAADCDAAELCDGVSGDCPPDGLEPDTTVCREAGDLCDAEETCDGESSDCPADGLLPANTVCRPASEACDAEEYCDGTSPVCPADLPMPDLSECANSSGICCGGECQVGWECCNDGDCIGPNSCYVDACQAGVCTSACSDPDCLALVVRGPAVAGQPLPIELHSCDDGLDPTEFVCFSERNTDTLVSNDFEVDLNGFSVAGGVSLAPEAQSTAPGSWGVQGVKLCGDDTLLETFAFDTTGRVDVGLSFSIANSSLGDRQMVGIGYLGNTEWRNLLVVGDGMNHPHTRHLVILSGEVQDRTNVQVRFRLHGGSAGPASCAYLDDLQVVDLLPATSVQTLWENDFEAGLAPFAVVDPDAGDADREQHDGSWMGALDDNSGAYFYTADPIDTTSVDPYSRMVLRWRWDEMGSLGDGQYNLVEMSIDGGSTWEQIAGTGHDYAPNNYAAYRVLLPCQARGIDSLMLRWHAPLSSDAINGDGVYFDDVTLRERMPEYIDIFDPFTHTSGGVYSGTSNSTTPGTTALTCRYGCGTGLLTSNQEPATFE